VRVSGDLRKLVFFFGHASGTGAKTEFSPVGTGFFVGYEGCRYLVTVKHIAIPLGDAPFSIRVNKTDGESDNINIDVGDIRWFLHPDPDVDLAIVPFNYDLKVKGCELLFLGGLELLKNQDVGFDCGDICYTIGLFQLLAGKKRNLPVVHTGNIALLPSDERVPVEGWEKQGGTKYVEGYLVQSESIRGLSGAPVFSRAQIELTDFPIGDGKAASVYLPRTDLGFLGVWQGAWDAKADVVRATSLGQRDLRVPVGMGIVIPAKKLLEILESAEVKKDREETKKRWEGAKATSLDSVSTAPPATTDAP